MGMYDFVLYEGEEYQTKEFDCLMDHYYIEGGRLLKSVGHPEDHSPATAWQNANPGQPLPQELEGHLGGYGRYTWTETGREDMNFHGWLRFRDGKMFLAKFTDGNLMEVKESE